MHTCLVEAFVSCTLAHFTAGRTEGIPRVYVPAAPPKKDAKKKEEVALPDVAPETREAPRVTYGPGRAFPDVMYGWGRQPGDERAPPTPTVPARPGTAGAGGRGGEWRRPQTARGGGGGGGGGAEEGHVQLSQATAAFLHQCLALLAGADVELTTSIRTMVRGSMSGAGDHRWGARGPMRFLTWVPGFHARYPGPGIHA